MEAACPRTARFHRAPRRRPFTEGLRAVEYLLESKVPMTALFCASDDIAYGAWQALERHGLNVPADVSLVGFDDQYGPFALRA